MPLTTSARQKTKYRAENICAYNLYFRFVIFNGFIGHKAIFVFIFIINYVVFFTVHTHILIIYFAKITKYFYDWEYLFFVHLKADISTRPNI